MTPAEQYLARLEAWTQQQAAKRRQTTTWTPQRREQWSKTMTISNAHLRNNPEWARRCSAAALRGHAKRRGAS